MPAPGSAHDDRQALSYEVVVRILEITSVTSFFIVLLLGLYAIIDVGNDPPLGPNGEPEITCEHVLPIMLHLIFGYIVYKMHWTLWKRHYNKVFFQSHGVDLQAVEAMQKAKGNAAKG